MQNAACLNETDLALSPIFIDFVARWLDGYRFEGQHWHDQLSETMSNPHARMERTAKSRLERIMTDATAQVAVDRVYEWFRELATGKSSELKKLHRRFEFISIVGIPRNGGSYLTAELFSALGYDPRKVPAALAHDGFPEARPFTLSNSGNSWIGSVLSMSEYLTMVEMYFSKQLTDEKKIVVPKKLTKGIYAGGFFNTIFGRSAEYFITVRHPIACCISTYEKSGGLPPGGRFICRSNIEKWIRRDICHTGVTKSELAEMDYFSAYVRYWEQFHINLALSGLVTSRTHSIVPFGKEGMEQTAAAIHRRFNSDHTISQFVSSPGLDTKHPEWVVRSRLAIERVEVAWRLVGLSFPTTQVLTCC